jgi:putative flippase GtrA
MDEELYDKVMKYSLIGFVAVFVALVLLVVLP